MRHHEAYYRFVERLLDALAASQPAGVNDLARGLREDPLIVKAMLDGLQPKGLVKAVGRRWRIT